MNVEIACYGEVAIAVGTKSLSRDVAEGATLGDLLKSLEAEFSTFDRETLSGGLVALVDGSHAHAEDVLSEGCRVSLSQSPVPDK
ncbi:MoaD/ThiS family protein [Haloferax sp. DFSO52]|uniref:MoaD/ThiS family protein n=1 Tax=Haloferax sp. DFSO52 TaxID=3388505 RepID=UPI003A852BBC